jgi:hypothetical protein
MIAPLAITIPLASAAQSYTEASNRSFLYVGVSPHTIGLGQKTLIVAWTADMPADVGELQEQFLHQTAAPHGTT